MQKFIFVILILAVLLFGHSPSTTLAKEDAAQKRKALYLKTAAITHIPWYYLAAIDQYERNVRFSRSTLPDPKGLQGIYVEPRRWVGALNPNSKTSNPTLITLFNGFGKDGDGDGKADQDNPEDVLYAMAAYLMPYGVTEDDLKIALWNYYHQDKSVAIILEFAHMFKHFNTTDLSGHAFPIPRNYRTDYQATWGDRRGWGGIRIHEGTDLFAHYGTPVRATSYGVVELIGWNEYGGWRIGIRDPQNIYHYYAHLNGYAKGIKKDTIVRPGQIIGYVGSSGYGPKGTQGKFPPHLHYGMYKYNGITEYSFDPYPHLRAWQRQR
ncbi:murein DD-endopeptidase MepM/ murein hydrolase activator NlpD [Pullulanibacillus pueri]|uniref:L-Ala--D-Glu endopeptidase n=1 Tax=Pullulanibacillus pueri TaxID=1437324 RepID=A0A8J3EL56_9BACL|nr:murein DD-endopeptidase MepM/ murein hydrolase activator NlpD [Pullulanibacillus pueri]GGH75170.1 L-Ala--D-Glu endopeptidase [Pullulanibacillus pueri]